MDEKLDMLQPEIEIEDPAEATVEPVVEATVEPVVEAEPEAPAEEAPAQEPSAEAAPAQEAPDEEAPVQEPPAKEAPPQPVAVPVMHTTKHMPAAYTQAFAPIREPRQKTSDATTTFAPIREKARAVAEPASRPAEGSVFEATTWQYLGWWLLAALITLATLGVGLAWAQCMFWRFRAKHTIISGRRMTFDGKGIQLFENYLVWGALTVITLGIYGLWVPVQAHNWYCSHLYLTGSRRRAAQPKMPLWRAVVVAIAALLVFALLLSGLIWLANSDLQIPCLHGKTSAVDGGKDSLSQYGGAEDPRNTKPPVKTDSAPTTLPPPTNPPETTPKPTSAPPQTTPKPTTPPAKQYRIATNGDTLNLRSAPSTNSKVLISIPRNTIVVAEDYSGNWIKVTYKGVTGWCSADWMDEVA